MQRAVLSSSQREFAGRGLFGLGILGVLIFSLAIGLGREILHSAGIAMRAVRVLGAVVFTFLQFRQMFAEAFSGYTGFIGRLRRFHGAQHGIEVLGFIFIQAIDHLLAFAVKVSDGEAITRGYGGVGGDKGEYGEQFHSRASCR